MTSVDVIRPTPDRRHPAPAAWSLVSHYVVCIVTRSIECDVSQAHCVSRSTNLNLCSLLLLGCHERSLGAPQDGVRSACEGAGAGVPAVADQAGAGLIPPSWKRAH